MKREIFRLHTEKAHSYAENSQLKSISYGEIDGIGIRVIKDNKQGFTSSTSLVDDINSLTQKALEIAEVSVEDPFVDISPGGKRYPDINGVYDETIEDIDMLKTAKEFNESLLNLAKETDQRISIDSLMVDIEKLNITVENTNGVNISEKRTSFSMVISGMAIEKSTVSSFDYVSVEDVNLQRFEKRAKQEIVEFVRKLVKTLYPKKAPSYKGLILLSPRAVEDILIDFIIYHVSGLRVVRNASIWKSHLDKQIVSSKLSMIDNPVVDGSPYATAFDREGSPTSLTPIIYKGTLENFLHNTYSAKVLGMPNTSHASGGYSSIPGISPHCLKIDGTAPLKDLFKHINKGILLERFSGNINYQTGMVSGIAKNSFFVENGEITYAITDTMVSFSVIDILHNIVDISTETKMLSTGPIPYILAEGVEVIGG